MLQSYRAFSDFHAGLWYCLQMTRRRINHLADARAAKKKIADSASAKFLALPSITAADAQTGSDEHEPAPLAPPAASDAASDAPSVLSVPLTPSHPFTPTL